ncbi:DNA replication protein psf2 [Spiromyces aspiralis]|uniref:DNA replication protein psf2 n=1 Tax=Spiromyces aspiralis TaxID=68401 RepID=A0ACC1HWS2_9FUNG|nr:DNA replication protein psf2 [Spiromyces aspiralis]
MALSRHQTIAFTPAELEFFAENEPITIVPTHYIEKLDLICGSFGPFRPPHKVQIPLWLAAFLKSSNKCRIVPPAWLEPDHLEKLCMQEEVPESRFSPLPPHYIAITNILFDCAEDDLGDSQTIRRLLQDIQEVRQGKVREGIKALNPTQLQMDNLSVAEINQVRPLFKGMFNTLREINLLKREQHAPNEYLDNEEATYSQFDPSSSAY